GRRTRGRPGGPAAGWPGRPPWRRRWRPCGAGCRGEPGNVAKEYCNTGHQEVRMAAPTARAEDVSAPHREARRRPRPLADAAAGPDAALREAAARHALATLSPAALALLADELLGRLAAADAEGRGPATANYGWPPARAAGGCGTCSGTNGAGGRWRSRS